jgi:nucleoside-diphosphate-sugar epimerase
MKSRVLITGVAGMIGSHLLDGLLARGSYEILGIDDLSHGNLDNLARNLGDARFTFRRGDVTDLAGLLSLGPGVDTIVHLAAVKKISEAESAMRTLTVNAKGTENVFAAAKQWGSKVIFASTSDVYGMSPDLPLREDGDLLIGPSMIRRWSYAVSKLYGEQVAFAYHADHRVPTVVLRYFGAFSPRSSFTWVGGHIPIFIHAILNDEEVVIHGDGTQTRSMAFVDDVVDGTLRAMETSAAVGQIINLGNDEEMSVIDCAHLIHRLASTGRPLRLRYVPFHEVFGQYKDIMRRVPDLTKAREYLGYRPATTTEEAIRRTIAALRTARAVGV